MQNNICPFIQNISPFNSSYTNVCSYFCMICVLEGQFDPPVHIIIIVLCCSGIHFQSAITLTKII